MFHARSLESRKSVLLLKENDNLRIKSVLLKLLVNTKTCLFACILLWLIRLICLRFQAGHLTSLCNTAGWRQFPLLTTWYYFFHRFAWKKQLNDGKDSVYMQSTLPVAVGLSCHCIFNTLLKENTIGDIALMFYNRMCGDFYTWHCFTGILLKEIL